jgi:acyl carrier protein
MNQDELKKEILLILKNIAPEVDEKELEMDENLRDQVDLDSIDYLNFLTTIGKKLNSVIPESDYNKLETLNNMTDYLLNSSLSR